MAGRLKMVPEVPLARSPQPRPSLRLRLLLLPVPWLLLVQLGRLVLSAQLVREDLPGR